MKQIKTYVAPLLAASLIGLWSGGVVAQSSSADNASAAEIIIEADDALEWNQNEQYYLATGNAYVERGNQIIEAQRIQAFYSSDAEGGDVTHVEAQGGVKMTDGSQSAKGEILDYDVATGVYILTGDDLAVLGVDATAKANKLLEFFTAEDRMHAVGDAEITLSDGRILKADDVTIQNLPDGSIDQIDALGNVVIILENGRNAISDEAVYTQKTGSALLTGNVTISEGSNILNGQKAEIDFNSGISRMLASGRSRVTGVFKPSAN